MVRIFSFGQGAAVTQILEALQWLFHVAHLPRLLHLNCQIFEQLIAAHFGRWSGMLFMSRF